MQHMTVARVRELAQGNEDDLRRELRADLLPPAIEMIRAGLKPKCETCGKGGQRWAVRSVLEIAKLVGAQPQVMITLFQSFGVRDESELKALVESGRKLERLGKDISHRQLFEDGLEAVRLATNSHPEWLPEARLRMGSHAVESQNGGAA